MEMDETRTAERRVVPGRLEQDLDRILRNQKPVRSFIRQGIRYGVPGNQVWCLRNSESKSRDSVERLRFETERP